MTVQPLWSRASIIAPARSNNLRISAFKVNFHWQYCRKSIIRIENRNILYMFFVLIYIYICLLIHTLNNPYVNDQWYLKVEWRFSGYLRCFIHPYWRDFPTIRSLCESWEEGWNLAIEKAAKKTCGLWMTCSMMKGSLLRIIHGIHIDLVLTSLGLTEKNSEAIIKQSNHWINLASSVLSKNSTLARNLQHPL